MTAKVYRCKCHGKPYTVCPLCRCQYCPVSWGHCPRCQEIRRELFPEAYWVAGVGWCGPHWEACAAWEARRQQQRGE